MVTRSPTPMLIYHGVGRSCAAVKGAISVHINRKVKAPIATDSSSNKRDGEHCLPGYKVLIESTLLETRGGDLSKSAGNS
jgi:hypothetical protein